MRHHEHYHQHGGYPNPAAVVYPTGMPQPFPCQLTTRVSGRSFPIHSHGAWLDAQGNGNTDMDAGHFHRVRGFKVLPDESDGHIHEMTTLPCGAGAPRDTGREGPLQGYAADGSMVSMRQMQMMGAGAGVGVPKWVWVVGGLAVVGAIVAAVVVYRKGAEEG
jgi:hypothetical protein